MADRASAHHQYLDEYGTVVDMVEDAGADPNGDEPINDLLEEYADDDTMLLFPPGRYRMNRQFRFTGFEHFAIVGQYNVTIVPDNYHDFDDGGDWNYRLFRLGIHYNPGRDLLFEDINIDQTADDTGVRVLETAVEDDLKVRNVNVYGQHDSGAWGPGRFVITDPDGSGVVENFNAPDDGAWSENTPGDRLWRGPTGILCNQNRGTMTFKDCSLGAFPDNGLYAANGSGQVIVDGGVYKNSQTASVRIGDEDSIVKNARIVVDDSNGKGNQHAIRAENSDYIRVIDCDIEVSDPNGCAIKVMDVGLFLLQGSTVRTAGDEVIHGLLVQNKAGMARVKESKFVHDAVGGFSVGIQDGNEPVYLEDNVFRGDGGHKSARAAIRCGRSDCQFRNQDVEQTGSSRRRALELHDSDALLYEGQYIGSMTPVINNGDNTWAESTDKDAALRLNDGGDGVYLKKNTLVNGVQNRSSSSVSGWGNSYDN
ncbi:hypothetical protein [Haladaptatus sp. DFWS20]|uniref:hypothetical protein n=1 Tax=Haladaptatus sp. DFWS20 TaxID=3403467 RepID=UPI003EC034B1